MGVAQSPPGLARPEPGRLPRTRAGGARALRRGARRPGARHLDFQHRRDRGRVPGTRRRRPAAGGAMRPAGAPAARARRVRAAGARRARPGAHHRHGLFLQRQGVRQCRTPAARGPGRRRHRRRRRYSVRQRAVRFASLELVSPEPCRPFDVARRGLSLGEAAGFALLERVPVAPAAPRLVGYGESADAHHLSAPHPQGLGAERALDDALARAKLAPAAIDYINLHGTASRHNDAVEAALIARRFPPTTLASSTKGWTGHTLGAAGIVEAVATLIAIARGFVPGTRNSQALDPVCGPQIVLDNRARRVRTALSNSFGFGGNNCCLVFATGDDA